MNERYKNPSKQEQSPLFDTPNGNLFRLTTRGKIVLAGATLVVGTFVANEFSGSNNNHPVADGTVAGTAIIGKGVNLRSGPNMDDPTGVNGTDIVYTVPPGVRIDVSNPVQVTSMGTAGYEIWYGLNLPGKGLVWMNDSEVEAQGLATTTYSSNSATLLDTTYKNGNYYFTTQTGQQQQAGTAEIVSAP